MKFFSCFKPDLFLQLFNILHFLILLILGKEVAEYCAQNFQNFLLDCEEYREGDINGALRKAFLAIDEAITSDEVSIFLFDVVSC